MSEEKEQSLEVSQGAPVAHNTTAGPSKPHEASTRHIPKVWRWIVPPIIIVAFMIAFATPWKVAYRDAHPSSEVCQGQWPPEGSTILY
jgi:hypothetical protein